MNRATQNLNFVEEIKMARQLTFTMDEDEGNMIISCLAVKPFQEVVDLIGKLQAQYQLQLAQQAEPVPAEDNVVQLVKEDGSPA
jgi:hypothetical protein